jgi:hypothetical protein
VSKYLNGKYDLPQSVKVRIFLASHGTHMAGKRVCLVVGCGRRGAMTRVWVSEDVLKVGSTGAGGIETYWVCANVHGQRELTAEELDAGLRARNLKKRGHR